VEGRTEEWLDASVAVFLTTSARRGVSLTVNIDLKRVALFGTVFALLRLNVRWESPRTGKGAGEGEV
jgi:hypothetical protein